MPPEMYQVDQKHVALRRVPQNVTKNMDRYQALWSQRQFWHGVELFADPVMTALGDCFSKAAFVMRTLEL